MRSKDDFVAFLLIVSGTAFLRPNSRNIGYKELPRTRYLNNIPGVAACSVLKVGEKSESVLKQEKDNEW